MVSHEAMAAILIAEQPLQDKAGQLIEAANHGGGRDNISVVLVQATEDSVRRGLLSRMLGN